MVKLARSDNPNPTHAPQVSVASPSRFCSFTCSSTRSLWRLACHRWFLLSNAYESNDYQNRLWCSGTLCFQRDSARLVIVSSSMWPILPEYLKFPLEPIPMPNRRKQHLTHHPMWLRRSYDRLSTDGMYLLVYLYFFIIRKKSYTFPSTWTSTSTRVDHTRHVETPNHCS